MKNIFLKLRKPLTKAEFTFVTRFIVLLQTLMMVTILIWVIHMTKTASYSEHYLTVMFFETLCNILLFDVISNQNILEQLQANI